MAYENKIRFGGWTRCDYRQVRARLRRFWMSDYELEPKKSQKSNAPAGNARNPCKMAIPA